MVKAAVLNAPGKNLEVKDFPLPNPEPGAVIIKMIAAGVCGTDVHIWHGRLKGVPYPVILGHENIGTIYKLGEGVTHDYVGNPVKEGDRVTFVAAISCGRCYYCLVLNEPTRCPHRKAYGVFLSCKEPPHLFGGYAEYVYLKPEVPFFKVPETLPSDTFIAFGCGAPTMMHGFEVVPTQRDETVVIQGSGPVGLFASILARESGASKVIMIGAPEKRLQYARELGVDHTINILEVPDPQERVNMVMELTDNIGADVVYECTGVPSAITEGIQLLRDSGRYCEIGMYSDRGPVPLNPHIITRKQLKIYGVWGWQTKQLYKTLRFVERIKDRYPLAKAITHRFGLEEATDALKTVEELKGIKVVITP